MIDRQLVGSAQPKHGKDQNDRNDWRERREHNATQRWGGGSLDGVGAVVREKQLLTGGMNSFGQATLEGSRSLSRIGMRGKHAESFGRTAYRVSCVGGGGNSQQ